MEAKMVKQCIILFVFCLYLFVICLYIYVCVCVCVSMYTHFKFNILHMYASMVTAALKLKDAYSLEEKL